MPNPTLDPNLKSWVESANDPACDFPIQNLALGAFEAQHDGHSHGHLCVAIGDQLLDVSMLAEAGYFTEQERIDQALYAPYWTGFTQQPELMAGLRERLQEFLRADAPSGGQATRRLRTKALRPISETPMLPPVPIFNYTDFYASVHHATTVGAMFRPDNPLLPNYKHVPIGYHGRASSIVVSGTPIRRPAGQQSPPDADPKAGPSFGPCKLLDYELELGCLIGPGNDLGEPVAISEARRQIFGLCLLNDWSARDIQKWEYQPLGPFLAKNFASTISPLVVTADALEPFRRAVEPRPEGDPRPLPYLSDEEDQRSGAFDITLEVHLLTEEMEKRGMGPARLSRGNAKDLYWTFAQMIAHHTSNGCNLQPGDLLGSGTISGTSPDSRGCLLELTWDGAGPDGKPKPRRPVQLPTGETRTFLQDGDTVIFRAFCEREGCRRIGFGDCRGKIIPAKA
ncbi:MAG: fumarylacetoacetase [Phycisphaerales bacterium]|nr:fumarylacetoacetase [Phycisphaerales bacterium]